MKRQLASCSSPSSFLQNLQVDDEHEPAAKRARLVVPSPMSSSDSSNTTDDEINSETNNNEEQEEEDLIVDEDINSFSMINDESENAIWTGSYVDEDEIIEIEHDNINLSNEQINNRIIVISDSESDDNNDDDQGIDVTDEMPPSVSSIISTSIFSPDNDEIEIVDEIVEEERTIMDEEFTDDDDDDDDESLEIVIDDIHNELIDLTNDESIPISHCSSSFERKLSTDVQQCPICLETLSDLQRTGVYLIITRCRHVMCTLCCRQLLTTSSRCPLCRENVSATTLIPYCILT